MQQILDAVGALAAHLWGGNWYDYVEGTRTAQTAIDWSDSWLGQLVTFINANPLVLCFIILSLVGIAVGMFKRLINN